MTAAMPAGEQPRSRAPGRPLIADPSPADAAGEVLRRVNAGRLRRASNMIGLVDRATQQAVRAGVDRVIPMPGLQGKVLPGQGLRRGPTVAVQGPTSLVLALLAGATRSGSWRAVAGMPALSPLAAAELGANLEMMALIPYPGPDWPQVVAALIDGLDVVVIAAPPAADAGVARRLAARARLRGAVLVGVGGWPGAELAIEADRGVWYGLGQGRGRLRCRLVDVVVRGRGAGPTPPAGTDVAATQTGRLPMIAEHSDGIALPDAGDADHLAGPAA